MEVKDIVDGGCEICVEVCYVCAVSPGLFNVFRDRGKSKMHTASPAVGR